jgi:hypothetical protein
MIQFKLVMRSLCAEDGKVVGWDEAIPDHVVAAFKRAMWGLRELKKITFPRSIQPSRRPVEPPLLLVFGDGSREAYATLAYVRWVLNDGSVQANCWENKSSSQNESFYSKDGALGSAAGSEAGKKD